MRKVEQSAEEFWREFEERRGEKVLSFALGRYLSGWPEEAQHEGAATHDRETAEAPRGPLWGLLIATERAFVFHHFPQASWLQALSKPGNEPREYSLSIPQEAIVSVEFVKEKSLLKRLVFGDNPLLKVHYQTDSGRKETRKETFVADTENKGEEVAKRLSELRASSALFPSFGREFPGG